MLRHDLGITIDTILTDLQIARVQSALKSGFVYVDGQTRRHSPFSFSIRGRSHQKSARVTQQESKGSSWFSSVQLIVRLSCWKNSVYTHFWLVSIKKEWRWFKTKTVLLWLKKNSEQGFDHQKPKNDIYKSEHFDGLDMCVLYQDVGGLIFG